MKKPQCAVCGCTNNVTLRTFANYKPLPGVIKEYPGIEWMCKEKHSCEAKKLKHLDNNEAINIMKNNSDKTKSLKKISKKSVKKIIDDSDEENSSS